MLGAKIRATEMVTLSSFKNGEPGVRGGEGCLSSLQGSLKDDQTDQTNPKFPGLPLVHSNLILIDIMVVL